VPKNNDFQTLKKLAEGYNGFLNDLLKLPIKGVSEVYLNALTQTLLEVHFPEMAKLKNTPEPWV